MFGKIRNVQKDILITFNLYIYTNLIFFVLALLKANIRNVFENTPLRKNTNLTTNTKRNVLKAIFKLFYYQKSPFLIFGKM